MNSTEEAERRTLVFDDYVETLFRRCPKCATKWKGTERAQWIVQTKLVMTELRKQGYTDDAGCRRDYVIRVDTREHRDCGGQMYTRGSIERETVVGVMQ